MIRIIKQQTVILKPDPNENPADPKGLDSYSLAFALRVLSWSTSPVLSSSVLNAHYDGGCDRADYDLMLTS